MGSYFSKKPKRMDTPFESLERKIEAMNPNSYPSFERSLDWSKTKHVYSDSICIHEKYVSWTVIILIFAFLFCFLFLSFSSKKGAEQDTIIHDEQDYGNIEIGDDVQ